MEEVGLVELTQDLWDSRWTLPLPGSTGASLPAGVGLKLWDSHRAPDELLALSRVNSTDQTLNAVPPRRLRISRKLRAFAAPSGVYGMPVKTKRSTLVTT